MLKQSIPNYFFERRQKLVDSVEEGVFVFPAAQEKIRNSDVHYVFRQDSGFYYLTGFDEPNACAVIVKHQGATHELIMFVQERDKKMEIWTGERYGLARAKSVFGATDVHAIEDFYKVMSDYLGKHQNLYYQMGESGDFDMKVLDVLKRHQKTFGRSGKGLLTIKDARIPLGELRLIKQTEEIEMMQQAAKASVAGHYELMKNIKPGMHEYEAEAIFEYTVKMLGCKRLGYPSIVAGGENATCLHYVKNDELLKEGDLFLVDAGAEYEYYSADITRTYPVGKKFSSAQKDIYDIVLDAQKQAIEAIEPGLNKDRIFEICYQVLSQGLIDLNVLKGSLQENIEKKTYLQFFPHSWGHWLGMDVHDLGLYVDDHDDSRKLEEGMCLTIEPGLYFQSSEDDYPQHYRGIGVRIEDDILVTKNGSENLTKDLSKEVADIELLREESLS